MEIVEFEPRYAEAFRTLNEAWISKHFTLEAKDREVLEDPQGKIIDKGGRIFIAVQGGEPVGCVAMIRMADGGYEVAKMTVAEELRGSGLGKRLMERCIEAGRALGARRLYLETNSSLAPALALYRAMGFRELDPAETEYARCDVDGAAALAPESLLRIIRKSNSVGWRCGSRPCQRSIHPPGTRRCCRPSAC